VVVVAALGRGLALLVAQVAAPVTESSQAVQGSQGKEIAVVAQGAENKALVAAEVLVQQVIRAA
jgi:hypothetical protein